jgi:hypothetical protein
MPRVTGAYLIRVGGKWALVSRLCPSFEVAFDTRKDALTYAYSIGWRVFRKPDWDRVRAVSGDLTVTDFVDPLTPEERFIVKLGLSRIRRLRKLRSFLSPLGLSFLVNSSIKKLTHDLKKWL